MLRYEEFVPSPRFAHVIECFWRHRSESRQPVLRIFPDGCMDILFEAAPTGIGSAALRIIGTMTRSQTAIVPARHSTFGVRFRPGMAARALRIPPAAEFLDSHLVLKSVINAKAARRLHATLNETPTTQNFIAQIESFLGDPPAADPVDRALAWLAQNHGQVPIDELADSASFSSRQFRRLCIQRTGVSPKHLARILRFRHAAQRAGSHGQSHTILGYSNPNRSSDWAQLAIDCGYFDQSHLINDFREFTGVPPTHLASMPAV